MKRKDHEKESFCSNRSKLDPIPLDNLKLTRSLMMKTHLKILLCQLESSSNDEKDIKPSKVVVQSLPLDLEIDILTRLPAKSLMKFLCVSKMWSSIFRSQRFIDSYYAMSSTIRSSRFLIVLNNYTLHKEYYKRLFIFSSSFEGEREGEGEESFLATNLEVTIPYPSSNLSLNCNWASVHGLIGCTTNQGRFIICNPSTKKVTTLHDIGERTYLGYDPVNKQFKVLTLIKGLGYYDSSLVHEVITFGGGGESSWRRSRFTTPFYHTSATKSICINGFVYFRGCTQVRSKNHPLVIVCFDVRYEKISFIKAPSSVVYSEYDSILMEYKGKLASVARNPHAPSLTFELWILEDVENHDWSKQTFNLPSSLWESMGDVISLGINKAGEIIFAPKFLSWNVEPFYIFFYNLERKDIRRVRLKGIADDEEFRHGYGITGRTGQCEVDISPQYVESIASL